MTSRSVCAVIVSYHPSASMVENIAAVLKQVQALVVVDNGSSPNELNSLRLASQNLRFALLENNENLGIAEALNRGVFWAKNLGYPWVVLFDQDSKITDCFVDQMLLSWEAHPERARVCSLHPRYVDPETGKEENVWRASDGGPVVSMTSGALMPTWIFDRIGGFASEYFIDEVDYEYCYRIRAAGYLIADSREATLLHSVGNSQSFSFWGFNFRHGHHNALRRYYMSRNRVAVSMKYFRLFPRWILHSMYGSLRETLKAFLAEDDRRRKFRNMLLGSWDGLTGRMGKREGL